MILEYVMKAHDFLLVGDVLVVMGKCFGVAFIVTLGIMIVKRKKLSFKNLRFQSMT